MRHIYVSQLTRTNPVTTPYMLYAFIDYDGGITIPYYILLRSDTYLSICKSHSLKHIFKYLNRHGIDPGDVSLM